MANAELNVTLRETAGKGVARSLRRQGLAPATVYGKGMTPCSLTIDPKALKEAIATEAGWNTLITLRGEGAFNGKVVILKDLQLQAIRREVMHADFQVIDLTAKVHVMVPVQPVGKSAGEKVGGSLQVIRKEIEVVCLPSSIPSAIDIDVTSLEIGDVVHVQDVSLPEGVEIHSDVNYTVITCIGHKSEEETEEVEVEEEEV